MGLEGFLMVGRLVGIATDVDVLVSAARDRPRGIG